MVWGTILWVPMNRLTAAGDIPDTGVPAEIAARMTIAEQYEWHQAHLRRHRASRRNFLRGSAAVAAIAAVGVSPFGRRAYAQDAPLAVANRRVGFGADASSQLRMAAQLSRNPSATKVLLDYGPSPGLGATVQAEVRNLVTQIPNSDGGVLAFNPVGSLAYVTGGSTVWVIDTATTTVIATFEVGDGPSTVAVSPDGTHVYINKVEPGAVSVITLA